MGCIMGRWIQVLVFLKLTRRNWTYVPFYNAEISAKIKRILYSSTLQRKKNASALQGCLVQVGNGIELDTVGGQFKPYL